MLFLNACKTILFHAKNIFQPSFEFFDNVGRVHCYGENKYDQIDKHFV